MYAALPHASLSADLSTLAGQMVSSGKFKTATVTPGGISATLANGSPAVVFADHVGDSSNKSATPQSAAPDPTVAARHRLTASSSAAETIAILVNTTDHSGAFYPQNQTIISSAVTGAGFSNDQYAVNNGNVGLDTIANLSPGGFVDYFDIATHGMVAVNPSGNPYYLWLSDTPITSAVIVKYAADYSAGNIVYATMLNDGTFFSNSTFAFTPQFVANHVDFGSGAIVVNESCFGQNPAIASQVQATLKSANVGRYLGWTQPVGGGYADQTDAFIWDRLLGEGSTTLGAFVTQRSPPQRPFPLDDIEGALGNETRTGTFITSSLNYTQSPASTSYPLANLVATDLGGESVQYPLIEYGLPSISNVAVTEDPVNPTLTIYGHFPVQTGEAAIIDPTQSVATGVTPTTWSASQVTIPIAVTGVGSKGQVIVQSKYGIQSNPVMLTQWTGTLTGNENATFTTLGGQGGTGSGQISTNYTIDFRADVHQTVPAIDTTPVPQNLAFTAVEGDSTAQVTGLTGTFQTSDGKHSAQMALSPVGTLAAGPPPFSNTFDIGARSGEPATCNNSMAGPQAGPTTVFCPAVGYSAAGAGTCTDDGSGLCSSAVWNATGTFGVPNASGGDGLLVFTMNPTTYAITVTESDAGENANLFETSAYVTGGVNGTINAPVAVPTGSTPSLRTHPPLARKHP
jgi:hypothetical protein